MTEPFRFPRSTPEAQGIASSAILDFIKAAEAGTPDLHSFMLLRHGAVAAEGWWAPYAPELPHMLFSLSKSYTSTAVGFAVAEGLLSVDDPVIKFFPEDLPKRVGKRLEQMQVRHLLSMCTGHGTDTTGSLVEAADDNWARAFLARPIKYRPGTHFLYNTGATYMLSAIVTKLTGQTLLEYLQPRLFAPLGIEGATWESCPRGINTGGFGLNVRTEDIARLGQLYLQKGMWQGQQLLTEAWVAEAGSKQIDNGTDPNSDWAQGYGYQFWRCRHNAYRGDGAFGQYCIVMPDQDAVVAITSGVQNMQAVMNLVWDILLPAMDAAALPADSAAQGALADKLASLEVPLQSGDAESAAAADVSGATYTFEPNELGVEAVSFDFSGDQDVMTVHVAGSAHPFVAGRGTWVKGETRLSNRRSRGSTDPDPEPDLVASSGAWTAPDTYTMKSYSYLTPFCRTTVARFTGDGLALATKVNVSFGPTEMPALVGNRK
jgi:CubicO group peptidase (beta-lactamase class C family)